MRLIRACSVWLTCVPAFAWGQSPRVTSESAAPIVDARHPTSALNGALGFERDGQLFVQRAGGTAARVSQGSAWHRDPSFLGDTLYFAADSSGHYDLFRLILDAQGQAAGAPTRLTTDPAHDVAPSASGDGRIVWQRGLGGDSRIWLRDAKGEDRRLTSVEQTERHPRFSADGRHVAYLVLTENTRKVVVRTVASGNEVTVHTDATLEDLAWAPDSRLAVSTRSGVYVVPTEGAAYSNLVSRAHGDVDWSPDGLLISIAEYTEVTVAYNGDPDRGVDRAAHERRLLTAAASRASFYRLPAPLAVDAGRVTVAAAVDTDRAVHNAAAFDRMWSRSARLYFADPTAAARRRQWEAIRLRQRPRALAATSDSVLARVLHETLRERPPLRDAATGRAAVSSAHPVATEAGLEVLRRGGNVVDAAVAVSFALGVVEPDASGIGGYGQMVIALKDQQPTNIEFMSRVPEEGGLTNTSLLENGRYPSDGPVLVNVPGTVAGMYLAWQRYGSKRVAWADLLAPAIRAARSGYEVSGGLATTLATEREHFAKYPGSRALFFRNGAPMVAGDTVVNPDLAWVLEQIAAKGADGFYTGEVASKYSTELRSKGNAMKMSDLARYFANERAPVCGTYRVYRICSTAPPVSGGADLVARLNLLEQFSSPSRYTDDAPTLHAALSAWFLTPSSRTRIADPAMWPVDVASIVNRDTAVARWRCYNADKALTPASVRGDTLPCLRDAMQRGASAIPSTDHASYAVPHSAPISQGDAPAASPCGDDHAAEMDVCHAAGTTAFTVADADGNAVAVTQTLGTWGGNFHVTPGLGFLSNDKLTSYGTNPTQYGSRLPFARHGSTIAPTIAFRGTRPVFAVGAAGNAWITSAVYQTLLGALDYGLNAQAALELPRFLPGGGAPAGAGASATPTPYTIQLEDGFAPEVITRLRTLGYDLSFVSALGELREGYGAAVRIDQKSVTAGADPRRAGAAGAVPR